MDNKLIVIIDRINVGYTAVITWFVITYLSMKGSMDRVASFGHCNVSVALFIAESK